jgi:hypothetical protein
MKHKLMVTIDVRSEDELVKAIDKVMRVPGVSDWTADDALSPGAVRQLSDLGHVLTHHKRARSWTAIGKANTR